jgi:hypothetical protein
MGHQNNFSFTLIAEMKPNKFASLVKQSLTVLTNKTKEIIYFTLLETVNCFDHLESGNGLSN